MSNRYKGAVISATPPTTTGGESGTASGAWTLEQQMQLIAAGLWPLQPIPKYIEDVFSTYLYTGSGAALTITNGINLSTNGGLVWIKNRSTPTNTGDHRLYDTSRGVNQALFSNTTDSSTTLNDSLTAFGSSGFTLGTNSKVNEGAVTWASWTFREQAKFFDIVTYTGTGVARTVAHNLGSAPGFIAVKRTDTADEWFCFHRSLGPSQQILLNSTAASGTNNNQWNNTAPTSSVFSLGTDSGANGSGGTYVAYLFAHDAGGFGLLGTDNVISCGSFTTDGSSSFTPVNLGYEPQWLMIKASSQTSNWSILDNMRGLPVNFNDTRVVANLADSETSTFNFGELTATGFNTPDVSGGGANPYGANATYIYIAIRRGPMKVPTVGTTVFTPVARTGTSSTTTITSSFPIDLSLIKQTNTTDEHWNWSDRLRGRQNWLTTSLDNPLSPAEDTTNNTGSVTGFDSNTALLVGSNGMVNSSASTYANYFFKRAPSFFDSVCYTGTGSNRTVSHNLGVAPELIIVKGRSNAQRWPIYSAPLYGATKAVFLNTTEAVSTSAANWNNTAPTSSVFTVGTSSQVNGSAVTYIAWLFATCAGVSKVGTYTGTGATLQIDCGFTSGARFVLIKAGGIASYVWNSASGIVSGNDPYLLINTNAAEVTNTDYIDTYSAGFELTSTASTTVNISGGQYIFLAIA